MSDLRGFSINLYESALRKSGGVLQHIASLTPLASGIQYDVLAQGWFGTATFTLTAPPDYLTWLYDTALEFHLELTDPELVTRYEGYVARLVLAFGEVKRSRALDQVFNEVKFQYGDNHALVRRDSDSIARWGKKRSVQSSGRTDATIVADTALQFLADHKDPHADITNELGGGNEAGGARLEITCQGYWDTLGWALYRASNRPLDTGAQIRRVLKRFEAGNRNNHGFLSTDYGLVPNTGRERIYHARDVPNAQNRIIKLMNAGDSNNVKLIGGVGPDRKFFVVPRSTTIDYFYDPYEVNYRDSGSALIPKWSVEPGRFIALIPSIPFELPTGDPRDSDFVEFIQRVTYNVDDDSLALEAPDGKNILRTVAQIIKATQQ